MDDSRNAILKLKASSHIRVSITRQLLPQPRRRCRRVGWGRLGRAVSGVEWSS
jgi:hypothetical protein